MLSTQNIDPNDPNQRRVFLLRWLVNLWHWVLPPTVAHSDRETAGQRYLRMGILLGGSLVAIVVAAIFAKPVQDTYQVWQADRYLRDARRFMDDKDIVSAILTAQKAVKIAPEHEPAVRMNAQLLTTIRRPQALYFWDKLEKITELTLEDQIGRARAMAGLGRPREAQDLLRGIIAKDPLNRQAMLLVEEIVGKEKASTMLLDLLKNFSEKNPNDVDSRLRLARLQLQSGDPGEAARGRDTLWQFMQGDTQSCLDAARLLADQAALDPTERRLLADRLDTHPLGDGSDWTRALSLRLSVSPEDRDRLIDQTVTRFRDKKGEALAPLMRWFTLNQEYSRVLTMLSEEDVKHVPALLLNYLTALSMLGRIDSLERLVNDPGVILSPATRSYYQVQLAVTKATLNGTLKTTAREDLQRRLRATIVAARGEGQLEMLLHLGAYCTDKLRDFYGEAADAYHYAANSFNARIEKRAFEGWIKAARLSGDSARFAEAAGEASRRWPDDKEFQENALYVRLLRGEALEISSTQAERLRAASPEDPVRKFLDALARWRLGDLPGAVAAAQRLDTAKITPGQLAVLAAIVRDAGPLRVASGDNARFQATMNFILQPLPRDVPLLDEETRLLARAEKE